MDEDNFLYILFHSSLYTFVCTYFVSNTFAIINNIKTEGNDMKMNDFCIIFICNCILLFLLFLYCIQLQLYYKQYKETRNKIRGKYKEKEYFLHYLFRVLYYSLYCFYILFIRICKLLIIIILHIAHLQLYKE